jgi:antirestriction protein ArdC
VKPDSNKRLASPDHQTQTQNCSFPCKLKLHPSIISQAKKERIDPYQVVTDTILKHLEEGVVPWRCPWNREVGRPHNYQTGRTYRGINQMLLGCRRFASPFWLTFHQVKSLGGSIRKGERGTMVVKYGRF